MIIIADDLTGSNDTGVQFVKQGTRAIVHLIPSKEIVMREQVVNVINTDSRALANEDAYKINRQMAAKVNREERRHVFKKVDSTLRGNIGYEIDAIMDELGYEYCAFAPAYPQNNRKTIGGYHLVRDVLLEDSDLANDVKFPMKESFIPALLQKQTRRKVGLVQIIDLRQGKIAEKVAALREKGVEIIVFDSATEQDLQTISTFLRNEEDVLTVGSAGLAQEIKVQGDAKAYEQVIDEKQLPVLTVAGSISEVSRAQIAYQKEKGTHQIVLHPLDLLNKNDEKLQKQLNDAKSYIKRNEDVVVTTALTNDIKEEVANYQAEKKLDHFEIGNGIAAGIGLWASALIKETKLSGLVLTGGDIAYQTCLHLNIHSLEILKEIEEGIPLSKVVEKPYDSLLIVTKAGAFGSEASLDYAVQEIKRMKGNHQ